jgi:hypothetical protein
MLVFGASVAAFGVFIEENIDNALA